MFWNSSLQHSSVSCFSNFFLSLMLLYESSNILSPTCTTIARWQLRLPQAYFPQVPYYLYWIMYAMVTLCFTISSNTWSRMCLLCHLLTLSLGFFHLFQAVYFSKLFSWYSEVFQWQEDTFFFVTEIRNCCQFFFLPNLIFYALTVTVQPDRLWRLQALLQKRHNVSISINLFLALNKV